MDWLQALDVKAAASNLKAEMGPNDWHQDPWGWPEIKFVIGKEPQLFTERCAATGSLNVASIDVPKENWGTRPAVLLDIRDRLMYQALVDHLSRCLMWPTRGRDL